MVLILTIFLGCTKKSNEKYVYLSDATCKTPDQVKHLYVNQLKDNTLKISGFKNLETLELESINADSIIIEGIPNLSNLKEVAIMNCSISKFPFCLLEQPKNLQKFTIFLGDGNHQNTIDSLLKLSSKQKKLNSLSIRGNEHSVINLFDYTLDSLRYLDISGANLKYLPDLKLNFHNLEIFTCSDCKIDSLIIDNIPLNINRLDLSNNLITNIPKSIKNLEKLESLGLSNNKISKLTSELLDLPKIKEIDLSGNLDMVLYQDILAGFEKKDSFRELELLNLNLEDSILAKYDHYQKIKFQVPK